MQSQQYKINTPLVAGIFIILLLSCLPIISFAGQVNGKVKYISRSNVYINLGREDGLQTGDQGNVYRLEDKVAQIEVIFIADHSASCRVVESYGEIKAGDKIEFEIIERERELESTPSQQLPEKKLTVKKIKSGESVRKSNNFSGSFSLHHLAQKNEDDGSFDFNQPSINIRSRLDNISRSDVNLVIRLRLRRRNDKKSSDGSENLNWNNRIYEIAFKYGNSNSNYSLSLGRTSSGKVPGIGYIDGFVVNYHLNPELSFGVLAGTEPDRESSGFKGDNKKIGFYTNYEKGSSGTFKIRSSAGIAGSYKNNRIDREFLYMQNRMYWGRNFSLHQSGEVNLYRGWRKELNDKSVELNYFSTNLRYRLTKGFSTSLGYNTRQTLRSFESRSLPDSLFDRSNRQGLRFSSVLKLPLRFTASVNGGLRLSGGNKFSSNSIGFMLRTPDLLETAFGFDVKFQRFNNRFSSGAMLSSGISRTLMSRNLRLALRGGIRESTYKSRDESISDSWWETSADYRFSKMVYGSVNYEIISGDAFGLQRVRLDFGIRIP